MVFLPRKKANQWENIFSGHDFGYYLPLYLSLWIHVCVTINHYKNINHHWNVWQEKSEEMWLWWVMEKVGGSQKLPLLYMWIHMYTYTYTLYMYIHTHTHTHTHIHNHIYIYIHMSYIITYPIKWWFAYVFLPPHIPFNKEKPKNAERWVVVHLPDGFWMCWCPYCWSSTLLIPRRNSEKSKILDVLGIARTGRSRKTDVSQKLMDFQKILESNIFHWRSIFLKLYWRNKTKKKSWWLLELIRWFGSVGCPATFLGTTTII